LSIQCASTAQSLPSPQTGQLLQSIKCVLRSKGAPAGYCPPPLGDVSPEQAAKLAAFEGFGLATSKV
jgi:hypothetical protein